MNHVTESQPHPLWLQQPHNQGYAQWEGYILFTCNQNVHITSRDLTWPQVTSRDRFAHYRLLLIVRRGKSKHASLRHNLEAQTNIYRPPPPPPLHRSQTDTLATDEPTSYHELARQKCLFLATTAADNELTSRLDVELLPAGKDFIIWLSCQYLA